MSLTFHALLPRLQVLTATSSTSFWLVRWLGSEPPISTVWIETVFVAFLSPGRQPRRPHLVWTALRELPKFIEHDRFDLPIPLRLARNDTPTRIVYWVIMDRFPVQNNDWSTCFHHIQLNLHDLQFKILWVFPTHVSGLWLNHLQSTVMASIQFKSYPRNVDGLSCSSKKSFYIKYKLYSTKT